MFRALAHALLLTAVAGCSTAHDPAPEPESYFTHQRKGANCQNRAVSSDYWQAAASAGIEFVRLIPDGWDSDARDVLIGDADSFENLHEPDVERLLTTLDDAETHGVKVVLAMFSLPGCRWRQLNGGHDDYRLWNDLRFHEQAASFWKQLAERVRDHPAIVGYNPLNEPHPEREHGFEHALQPGVVEHIEVSRGTAADVNRFHRTVVAAIREVDRRTPIILDGTFYASFSGIRFLEPVDDPAVLYAFHFYEPWNYTTYRVNGGSYAYPDRMPEAGFGSGESWTIDDIERRMAQVAEWAAKHEIPRSRIICSEFGCDRRVDGAQQYLADVIEILNGHEWHWAFYAFRGDGSWGGMDYELGTGKLGWEFWKGVERGEHPDSLKNRHANPLWNVIARELTPQP